MPRLLTTVSQWKLYVSLCIRRPAVVTPPMNEVQQKVTDLLSCLEFEKSYLSSHELRDKCDQARLSKALEKGKSKTSAQESVLLTAREQELEWLKEMKEFKPRNLTTEADISGNLRTAWRKLDRPLLMLVKQNFGVEEPFWSLPVMLLNEGQNLREAAESLANNHLPPESKYRIFGNCPSAVYVYKYRENTGTKVGVQVYFFNAYVDRLWRADQMLPFPRVTDFAWVTKDQLPELVENKALLRTLNSFVVEY